MKIALCLSGEMRYYKHPNVHERFLNNFYNIYKPDIFISTWDHCGKSEHSSSEIDPNIISSEDLLAVYPEAKRIEVENFSEWLTTLPDELQDLWFNHRVDGVTRCTSIPQLYKIYRANELKCDHEKQNNFVYDVVFRYRPDLIMLEPLELDKCNLNAITHMNTNRFYWANRIYDIFFFSNSINMNKICNAWLNYLSLIKDGFYDGRSIYDATRLFYLQARNEEIDIASLERNICDVYRGESVEYLHKFLLG